MRKDVLTMNAKLNTSDLEITPLTMAVLAEPDEYGNISTRVLEDNNEYVVNATPSKVIDDACRFFGADLKGRQQGARNVCGFTHKAPIAIDSYSGMYFFPTASPRIATCSWFAHTHIIGLNDLKHHGTEIVFNNDKKVIVNVSYGSIKNQVYRTAQFRFLLNNRITSLGFDPRPDLDPFS